MNAIKLLKENHRSIESWFREFEIAGDGDYGQKQWVVEQLFYEFDIHTELEEQIFYPAVQEGGDERHAQLVRMAADDHAAVKQLVDEIKFLAPYDEQYDAKLALLQVNIQHHIEEEEAEIFPCAERAFDDADLEQLGREMLELKQALTLESMLDSQAFSNGRFGQCLAGFEMLP